MSYLPKIYEPKENDTPDKIMEDILNDVMNDDGYWKKLSEQRKKAWVEHYMYGDMFIPLFPGSKDPFPQPPL